MIGTRLPAQRVGDVSTRPSVGESAPCQPCGGRMTGESDPLTGMTFLRCGSCGRVEPIIPHPIALHQHHDEPVRFTAEELKRYAPTPREVGVAAFNQSRAIQYRFVHEDGREFIGSVPMLVRALGLPHKGTHALRKLTENASKRWRGWRCVSLAPGESSPPKGRAGRRGRSHAWRHEDGRTFTGTVTEMARTFPREDLSKSSLHHVVLGMHKSHRGWALAAESRRVS